jgi:hypothetical protein
MKINAKCIVAAAIGITLFLSAGLLLAQQPKGVYRAVTLPGVHFSRVPQGVQMERPAELANIPPAPAPLPAPSRQASYNQIRAAAGLMQATTAVVAPAHVILTPDAPKSGQSSYALYNGYNYPDPRVLTNGPPEIMPITYSTNHLTFTFDTIPGKTYMVDLFVSPQKMYTLQGAFTGTVAPQNGHLIIGFTANSRVSQLRVLSGFYFFRCELTQVH